MKKVVWIAGVILVLLAGYVAAGPYLTVSAIKTGVIEQDSKKLSENIDFPKLRQNLKGQLNAAMMKNISAEEKDNPFAVLAAGLAMKMADAIVDSYVTPSGLALMMEGKEPPKEQGTETAAPPKKDELFRNARYSYDSINQFSIWVPDDKGQETRFVLQRDGLSWKLVNLVLPI
ncbi:MAG: DUF2939 domain-containing protein [Acidiferrobacteraceae bacterium]